MIGSFRSRHAGKSRAGAARPRQAGPPASRERPISIPSPVRSQVDASEPIVAELFSVERLEQHGESLAAAQSITRQPRAGRPIRPRVADNGRVLLQAYRVLAQAIKDERSITPAAEWLVDNFHIVEEQLREIRDDLPTDYYRELPKLADGHLEGYPRVLGRGVGLHRPHRQPL